MKHKKTESRSQWNKSGSATVMVIMIVMTLMLFGVFSMMSSYAGLSIARRNAEWTQLYYKQESQAAEKMALIHETIKKVWHETDRDVSDWQQEYYLQLRLMIEETASFTPVETDPIPESPELLSGSFIIPADEAGKTRDFMVSFKVMDDSSTEPLIQITAWKSLPEIFEYDDQIEFWDVEVEGTDG